MRLKLGVMGMILFFFGCVRFSFADVTNKELMGQIQELRKIIEMQNQKITALESKVEVIQKPTGIPISGEVEEHIEKRLLDNSKGYQTIGGLRMEAGATFVGQQAFNANRNVDKKGSTSNDASYSIDLALEKEFSDWGRAFMHVETGDGLAGDQRTALFSTVNRDADDSDNMLKLTEAYYEHYLFDKQVGAKFGQIDATIEMDENEFAHDETTQFLSYMFRNSPVIDFPGNHLGTKLFAAPKFAKWIELSTGYMDGDADGVNFMNSGFMFGQINLKPTFLGENRPGNYRFYSWRNESSHTKWLDSEVTGRAGYGFGLSFDQRLTDHFGVFSRYGWQDKNVYLLENAWSAGVRVEGSLWHRKDDHLGVAFGQAYPGKSWRVEGDSLDPAIIRSADTESHLELYYSFKLNDHLTISPNFQWIWNPYGLDTNPSSATDLADSSTVQADFSRGTAYLLGLRAQVDL